jgi:hypothetical protein
VPVPDSNSGNAGQIIFADVDSVSSYDTFRSGAGRAMIGAELFAGSLLPQNGTLRTTTLYLPLN